MDYHEQKAKGIIREAIWQGIIKGTNVGNLENPYAMQELLEQNSQFLNVQTQYAFEQLKALSEEKI